MADRGKRELVLRGGQPFTVLPAAASGDRRVLHVYLEEGERADGARRAGAQRCQHDTAVQDEGELVIIGFRRFARRKLNATVV